MLILTDFHRGSYQIVGNLFYQALSNLCEVEQIPTPQGDEQRKTLLNKFNPEIALHNTLGNWFIPLKNCYNIALPFHEWSEYPKEWIKLLNQFNEVWTTTDHIQEVLKRGGLTVPVIKLPPALDSEDITEKKNLGVSDKPRFLFVGEPHFRKGNHLLMQGFMKAFPEAGSGLLTIKTSPSCDWVSPRDDIILIKENWSREKLLAEYSNHDCFVSASLAEGLGLPIAEAIMAKLPICTNFWGGHKSLLTRGGFVEIEHEEIIQPFTSDPAFYAEGQKCAYSSPQEIAKSMKLFNNTSILERKKMALLAKKNFLETYGRENTLKNIHSRILEISKK
jgi:glycosyltransferase involved in cell wall biosynthesis